MSSAESQVYREWELPPVKPLDEAVWDAWVAKGRARDLRSKAVMAKTVAWLSMAGLLVAAGIWYYRANLQS